MGSGWSIPGSFGELYADRGGLGSFYLRATATYADGLGAGKTAQVIAPQVVIAYRLSALTVPGLTGVAQDDRAFYPAFDSDTLHHATRCTASVTLTLTPRTPIRACRSTACRGRRGELSP